MTATVVLVLRILLAAVLYIFIWRVLQTLWQEIRQQSTILATQKKSGIHIIVKTEEGREARYHFWQPEIVIGRGPGCDIVLKDEALSANHARLSRHHGHWWLEDLGSTNGTFLNTDQISVPTVVIDEDQFKCGKSLFTLRLEPVEDLVLPDLQNQNGGEG